MTEGNEKQALRCGTGSRGQCTGLRKNRAVGWKEQSGQQNRYEGQSGSLPGGLLYICLFQSLELQYVNRYHVYTFTM